jgi:segregation and condensation protein A
MGEEVSKEIKNNSQGVGQEQVHDLLFSKKLSWQGIIYDLINTEQLDPWNLDLVVLSNKYLERISELEEADFFVSSKVLLAASLLLRIKSEVLLNNYIPELDEILFGSEEKKVSKQETLEFDDDVPELVPRTPIPRYRKVTLQELMGSLGKAIKTENRRIEKISKEKQRMMETEVVMPKTRVNLKDKIREVYQKVKSKFVGRDDKLAFSELLEKGDSEEKVNHFVPLLHLDHQNKVILEQEKHFDEIYLWTKGLYEKKFEAELEKMRKEADIDEIEENLEKESD